MGWSVGQLGSLLAGWSFNLWVGRCVVRLFGWSCRRSVVWAIGIWLVDWLESWWVGLLVGLLLGWLVGWWFDWWVVW